MPVPQWRGHSARRLTRHAHSLFSGFSLHQFPQWLIAFFAEKSTQTCPLLTGKGLIQTFCPTPMNPKTHSISPCGRMSSGRLADVYREAEKCRHAVIQRGNRGTHATLTESTIFSMARNAEGQPEGHLGDNKGTSEGHLGDTNHTDTLITQSTRSTKHTHNKSIITRITLIRQPFAMGHNPPGILRWEVVPVPPRPGAEWEECLAQSRKDAKEAG